MINQFKQLNLGTKRLIVILSFLLPLIPALFHELEFPFWCVGGIASIWLIVFIVLWIRDGYKQSKNIG